MPKPIPNFTNGYDPKLQRAGKFKDVRGNSPGDLTDDEWEKVYNAEDTRWRRAWGWTVEQAAAARECGGIRKKAIEELILKGELPRDFEDNNQ